MGRVVIFSGAGTHHPLKKYKSGRKGGAKYLLAIFFPLAVLRDGDVLRYVHMR